MANSLTSTTEWTSTPTPPADGIAVRQNRHLAGLRDTLLPKLLSGEIDLPPAANVAEEVV